MKNRISQFLNPLYRTPNKFIICLFLLITTMIVYSPVRYFEFINLDDGVYVTENDHIKNGFSQKSIHWAFKLEKDDEIAYWHPVTCLSHMLDCHFFGLDSGMHHLFNLLYHLLNIVLLFLVFTGMTGSVWKSAFVAMFFALHPINVDSVAWIAERKNLISTTFWLLTILFYIYYSRKPSLLRYLLVLTSFSLGLMSKPMLITLPCALLLLDFWPLYRFKWLRENWLSKDSLPRDFHPPYKESTILGLVVEKIPMFCLSFASIWISIISLQDNVQILSELIKPLSLRISNAIVSYISYILKLIWPVNFAIFYPFPTMIPLWKTIFAASILIALTGIIIIYSKKKPYLATGWFWYLGTLVPAIGLIQSGLWPEIADRWAYVPFIGLFIIIVWGVPDAFNQFRAKKTVFAGFGITSLLLLAILTSVQLTYWKDSFTVFKHALDVTKNNQVAHMQVGCYYAENNQHEQALRHFAEAIEIQPNYSDAHENIGMEYTHLKDYSKAIHHYEKALFFEPFNAELYNKIGNVYTRMNKHGEAVRYFTEAIEIDSNEPTFYNNLGVSRYFSGNYGLAIETLKKAIKIKPDYSEAYYNLGLSQTKMGNSDEAAKNFLRAIQLDPDYKEAHNSIANIFFKSGKTKKALNHYSEVIRITPDDETAHFNTGIVLLKLNRPGGARKHFLEALRLNPDYLNAKNALAQINQINKKNNRL